MNRLLWMGTGALLIVCVPVVVQSVTGPFGLWWLGRATGVLAYGALWLSTFFGVLVSSKGAGGLLERGTIIDLHRGWSSMALAATVLHILLIIANTHSGVNPLAAILPQMSTVMTGAITLGTVSFWGILAISLSTTFMNRIPNIVWRGIHASAFGTYVLALSHSLLSRPETNPNWGWSLYISTSALLLGAVIQRLLVAFTATSMARELRHSRTTPHNSDL